jgi:hypothetical protein
MKPTTAATRASDVAMPWVATSGHDRWCSRAVSSWRLIQRVRGARAMSSSRSIAVSAGT